MILRFKDYKNINHLEKKWKIELKKFKIYIAQKHIKNKVNMINNQKIKKLLKDLKKKKKLLINLQKILEISKIKYIKLKKNLKITEKIMIDIIIK